MTYNLERREYLLRKRPVEMVTGELITTMPMKAGYVCIVRCGGCEWNKGACK